MPFNIGATELILILVLVLIIFGPNRLPELGRSIGKTIKEFRRSSNENIDDTVVISEPKTIDTLKKN